MSIRNQSRLAKWIQSARRGLQLTVAPAAMVALLSFEAIGAHAAQLIVVPTGFSPAGSLTPGMSSAVTVKPGIRGLINDGQLPPTGLLHDIAALEVAVAWSDLQPTPSYNALGRIVHPNAIDRMINYVQKYAPVPNLTVMIRVWTGTFSPSWALNLDGSAVLLNDYSCANSPTPPGCNGGTHTHALPRWWDANYQAAYDRLQLALGAAYDGNSRVAQVTSPRCMVYWDEPMVRPWDSWSMTNLLNAGYTTAKDITCQKSQLTSLGTAWPHTVITLAVNYYVDVHWSGSKPAWSLDLGISTRLAQYCRSSLGLRCLLENEELGRAESNPASPTFSPVYTMLARLGPPLSFMVDQPAYLMTGWTLGGMLSQAINWGANSVEIGRPYTTMYPPPFFDQYASGLAANPW